MNAQLNNFGRARVLKMFADWTDRIKAGELPPAPQRPQGAERNVVITQWDWADPKAYLHDVRLDRPAQPAGQPERAGVRRAGTERRLHAGAESGHAHGEPDPVDGPRSEHAADQPGDAGAVALLGRRADLDQQEQRPQPDARSQGPGVADLDGPAGGQSRRLQGGFEPPVGEALPGRERGPPPRGVRPLDEEADAHRAPASARTT